MSAQSPIEWTDATWNPVTGCDKVSAGCKFCYAEKLAERLKRMGNPRYADGFAVRLQPDALPLPTTWRKPRRIFVNSMSDLFHKDVPDAYIHRVWAVMQGTPRHTYQVLTKRADRLASSIDAVYRTWNQYAWGAWPLPNVWLGVSVEDERVLWRIDHLRAAPAAVRFLSIEPLIGPLPALDLTGIHWVIVGGESGPGARPMDPAWDRSVRDQCVEQGVPFFFKQWGGVNKKKTGRILDGRTWDQLPETKS